MVCIKSLLKRRHPLHVFANDGLMLIAGRGEKIMDFFALPVAAGCAREGSAGDETPSVRLLFFRQFAPEIHWMSERPILASADERGQAKAWTPYPENRRALGSVHVVGPRRQKSRLTEYFAMQSICMENNWAAENLQTIRTLMERSAIYRRALAPVMIFVGAMGAAAAFAGVLLKLDSPMTFVGFWITVAVVTVRGAFLSGAEAGPRGWRDSSGRLQPGGFFKPCCLHLQQVCSRRLFS